MLIAWQIFHANRQIKSRFFLYEGPERIFAPGGNDYAGIGNANLLFHMAMKEQFINT
jgi:hypothetical protein